MKRQHFFLLCSIVMHLLFITPAKASEDFKLVKQEGIISLYERWIPAAQGGMVREIKAVLFVKSDIDGVTELLMNEAKGTDWNANASEYKTEVTGANSWTTYIKYDIPWPMEDQDCCLAYRLKKINNRLAEINFESTNSNSFPVYKDASRMTGTKGKWILEDEGSGNTKLTYTVTTDKSKKIPRWVSDPIIHNNLFKTMAAFKSTLEKQ